MKKRSALIVLLVFIGCGKKDDNSNQFIEFVHLGYTTHEYPILLISSKRIDLKLNDSQLKELKQIDSISGGSGSLTERQKELYLNINYNRIITDNKTFSLIRNFVMKHNEFYASPEYLKLHPMKESFEVVIDGKKELFVNENLKNQFVNDLIMDIKQFKGSESITKEIAYLRQNDF